MTVCKFFLEGRCRFGQNCRFEHPTPGQNQNVFRLNNQNNQQQNRQQYFGSNQQQPQRYFGQQGGQQAYGNQQKVFGQRENQGDLTVDKLIPIVKEDATTWQKSGQWLFSCYAPLLRRAAKVTTNHNEENLPGFEDISPEELRWEAMTSHASNNFQGYVQKLQELSQKYRKLQESLQTMDQTTADFIVRYERGENANPAGLFGSAQNQQVQSPTLSSFSFKLAQSASPAATSASPFRFQLPNQPAPSSFGQPSFGSPLSNQSSFGQPAQSPFAAASPHSSFGQQVQSPFGQAQQSPFGQGFQSPLGQPQAQQPAAFPQSPQPTGLFNQSVQSPFGQQVQPSNIAQTAQATGLGVTPFGAFTPSSQTIQPANPAISCKLTPSNVCESASMNEDSFTEFKAEKFTFGKIPRIPPPRELR